MKGACPVTTLFLLSLPSFVVRRLCSRSISPGVEQALQHHRKWSKTVVGQRKKSTYLIPKSESVSLDDDGGGAEVSSGSLIAGEEDDGVPNSYFRLPTSLLRTYLLRYFDTRNRNTKSWSEPRTPKWNASSDSASPILADDELSCPCDVYRIRYHNILLTVTEHTKLTTTNSRGHQLHPR